jgi:hypothetical protein
MIPVVLLVFAGIALYRTRQCWAPGTGPFDQLPEGTTPAPVNVSDVYAASKTKYRVTTFARGAEQHYHVAVRASNSDWIGFLVDDKAGTRMLYRANAATVGNVAALRKDFAL